MSSKVVDEKICKLIKESVSNRHRSMLFILGENSRNQVVILYHLLLKYRKAFKLKRPFPLWCFKKDLGFNTFQNKKLKKLRKNYNASLVVKEEDVFEYFLLSSNMQVCHYSETDTILGQTFGFLVIQDFCALTPNTLARIIETVEGGGMILFLLPNISSLEDLFSLHMDAHSRFVTEAYDEISPLFNRRFVLSLLSCQDCLVLDDSLTIKLIPEKFLEPKTLNAEHDINQTEHNTSNEMLGDNFKKILSLCCTSDQSDALRKLADGLSNKSSIFVSALTSGRGRGKSAVLGLAICLALDMQFSNIIVTSPHLENVQTLFSFLIKGLKTLGFRDGKDFKVSQSVSNNITFTKEIKMIHNHRQIVSYVSPLEFSKLSNAELVVIDEAAAIPSSIVKQWIGSYNVFMASTINGYEGTGRSLSLKLINQIRAKSTAHEIKGKQKSNDGGTGHILHEITLNQAIRYADGDQVEDWLNRLLCLDAATESLLEFSLPPAKDCKLYYVNKEALFSYNKYAESFLQKIISLFVISHYKNSPNDLLMMADAPAHQIFCLLPPTENTTAALPPVICVIQVALEGKITAETYNHAESHGRRASGDLIPWTISQQFQDDNFPNLAGARIVRIATHPECQSMGYGQQALQLLCDFYSSKITNESNTATLNGSGKKLLNSTMPLLYSLEEAPVETLDYIGVSYGLTTELLKFWKRAGFIPLYIRQTTSDITGEHSCIMVKSENKSWLSDFYADFASRFVSLLPSAFKSFNGSLALSILHCKNVRPIRGLTAVEMQWFLGTSQLKRLKAYCNNQIDHHLVLDLIPRISELYFLGHLNSYFLSSVQEVILLCTGLQSKSMEETSAELNIETQQVMGCFRKAVKKIANHLSTILQVKNKDELNKQPKEKEKSSKSS